MHDAPAMTHPTRRSVLKGMAAGLTLAACSSTNNDVLPDAAPVELPDATTITPPESLPESTAFVLGVSAGDLARDRAMLWTRYSGSAELSAYVWRMADRTSSTYVEQLGPFPVTPGDGGYAHVAVEGLQAGAFYRYAFVEASGRSRIGRFRTAIADTSTETITFGAVACTESSRPFTVLARAAERTDLDAFIFAGDNAYCDGAETLAEYRHEYEDHFGRPDHVAVRAQTGMYITWDDHEVKNDWNPETIDEAQLAAAFDAFFEHAPIVKVAGNERRIWRSSRWGHTVEVFVLDSRSERKPSTLLSSAPQYISAEQMAWLTAGLQASPAAFKLIVNSVPITNMPNVWDAYPTDRWEAYGGQRTEILQFIDDNAIRGVLWLAGDFHLAFISTVSTSGAGSTQREVLCGPGGQNSNALLSSLTGAQFAYRTGTNNYTSLKFDPVRYEITVGYHDAQGTQFHTETLAP